MQASSIASCGRVSRSNLSTKASRRTVIDSRLHRQKQTGLALHFAEQAVASLALYQTFGQDAFAGLRCPVTTSTRMALSRADEARQSLNIMNGIHS